jgi:hypothetical protein
VELDLLNATAEQLVDQSVEHSCSKALATISGSVAIDRCRRGDRRGCEESAATA